MYIKNQIFKKNSYRNIFFILLLYYTLTEKLHENALSKKKVALFFQLETFLDKTTFNFHLFNKVNNFVILMQYSIHFIQTRSLDRMRMEFSW